MAKTEKNVPNFMWRVTSLSVCGRSLTRPWLVFAQFFSSACHPFQPQTHSGHFLPYVDAKWQIWQFVCISSSTEPIIWWGLTWYLDQNDFANLFTCPLVWPIEQNTQSKANSHGWWRPGLQRQFQKAIGFGKLISWRVLQGDISWWKWKGWVRVGGDIRKLITSAK